MFIIQNDDNYQSIYEITDFLLSEISCIFGSELLNNEDCLIKNIINANCPILLDTEPSIITLSLKAPSYWCQLIFQLSHEMCHFAIRQTKEERYFTLSWYEEIVCEAFSLYCLRYAYINWQNCNLSKFNKSYAKNIEDYLIKELSKKGSDIFKNIIEINLLKKYEEYKMPELDRESHCNERNALFYEMVRYPNMIKELCNYHKYIIEPECILIDFTRWITNTENELVILISDFVNCK